MNFFDMIATYGLNISATTIVEYLGEQQIWRYTLILPSMH